MIIIPDVPRKEGNKTIYEDVELQDLNCPCCGNPMKYKETKAQLSQGPMNKVFKFRCDDCLLLFQENDFSTTFMEFYEFVKEKVKE